MDSFEIMHGVANEMKRQGIGISVTVEGGGAAIPFIEVAFHDGSFVLFGNVAETWGGQTYPNIEALETGDYNGGKDTSVFSESINVKEIVEGFREQFIS